MAAIPLQREVHYPESDGKPMAESELHRDVMTDLIHALKTRYAGEPNVYVGGNLLLYYVEGDPRKSVSPDVLVTWGIRKGRRRKTYLLWKEGRAPGFVIEVTSDTTRTEDLGKKKELYLRLGVEEYILFDPLGDYLHPRLRGHRLVLGRYQTIPLEPDGSLLSRTTGLRLRIEGENLRLIDEATGERFLFVEEERVARLAAQEEARAAQEKARGAQEEARAAQEEARAARERAEQEAEARRALEEEIERLRRELGRS
jgi:Uma2 family endonuclease